MIHSVQFILMHSRSDVGPQDFNTESVEKFHTEDLPPISTKPPTDHQNILNTVASDSTANDAQSSGLNEKGDIIIDVVDLVPQDFLSDIFTRAMMSEDSAGTGASPQDGPGLSLNIANHEPQHWSFFQKLARDELPQKVVSLIDQHQLTFSSRLPKVDEASGTESDSKSGFVEDEEKNVPRVTESDSVSGYNPSQVDVSDSMQFADMVENMRMQDSEYEVNLHQLLNWAVCF